MLVPAFCSYQAIISFKPMFNAIVFDTIATEDEW